MKPRVAVVLFQLGGPDSLEAVEPFLYNLFLDPDIIDFPLASLAREPLARLISTRRSKKVAEKYSEIGGRSPILELTQQQAAALRNELRGDFDVEVFVAMRYWHPLTESVARQLAKEKYDEVILLPLYPQYSKTTTGSSINEWNRWCISLGLDPSDHRTVFFFFDHPLYVESIVDRINESVSSTWSDDSEKPTLVFSAHGVPMSVVRSGDPYKDQVEQTVELVMRKGGWKNEHVICYQSKVGPAKWLRPSLDETIAGLGEKGIRDVLIVPIAFVSDHIETLHEIDLEAREFAHKVGVTNFAMVRGLNDHPTFIRALADLVRIQLPKDRP
jgi:ferrochelatase